MWPNPEMESYTLDTIHLLMEKWSLKFEILK